MPTTPRLTTPCRATPRQPDNQRRRAGTRLAPTIDLGPRGPSSGCARHTGAANDRRAHQDHLRHPVAPTTRSSTQLYEAGPREGEGAAGRVPPQPASTAWSATATGTFEVRSPIDTRHPRRHVRARARRAGRAGRDRRRPPRAAGLVPPRLGEAPRDPAPRRGADLRAPDGVRGPDGDRGGQDPPRGPGRGRGGGRPHPLLREDGRGQRVLRPPDGQPGRRRRPHPVDPAPARRVRGHQPVQLPDGARRRPDGGRDDGRQRGRVQAGVRVAR